MTRICFLGNSHLACLKLAAVAEPASLPGGAEAADWFAGSSTTLTALKLDQGRWLTPRMSRLKAQMAAISGGQDRVDLLAYDIFVIGGIGLEYPPIFDLLSRNCLFEDVEKGRQLGRTLISASFFRAFLADLNQQRPAARIAGEIRAVNPTARIALLTSPYPAETILGHRRSGPAFPQLKDSDYFAELADFHLAAARAAAAAVGATLVPQDPETIAAPGFTRAAYNRQAVGLQTPSTAEADNWHGEKTAYDPWHMNAEFGRRRLLDLARALEAVPLAAAS